MSDKQAIEYYTLCRLTCKLCGDVIERTYKSSEDYGGGMETCSCGAFSFDPHPLWPRLLRQKDVDPSNCEEYYEVV